MSDSSGAETPQARRKSMTRRAKDFSVLVMTTGAVMLSLLATGSLSLIEALVAMFVIGSVAAAYYVGSAAMQRPTATSTVAAPGKREGEVVSDLLAALPLPAFEISEDARIVTFNTSAASFLRLDPRRANSPPRASVIVRSPALLAAIETALQTPSPDGQILDIESSSDEQWRAHIRSIRAGRLLVVLEDLTPVKRAAKARADFLANASHELRTPLTAVSGFIETMRGPARDDKESWGRFLDIMAGEADRMSRLITDLLSLSRIESSEHVQPSAREHIVEIVSSAVDALQPVALERGLELVFDEPETGLPAVTANHDELIQVVENLVSNAIKYSGDSGRIFITCGTSVDGFAARAAAAQVWEESERMTLLHAPGRTVVGEPAVWVRVEDDGPGIEREHLPRLGERFYRADQSRGGKVTGTGLGLAIVKHIMAHHRGGLAVETRIGQGTAFGFWLPAAREI